MNWARQRVRDERGAVLVAGLLLTLAVLIVIGAAVDIGRAFIERRELVSLADGAALSGSQTLDLEALHAGRLALDPSEAHEALANAAKHSDASRIDILLEQRDGGLLLSVRDDGRGGADAARGSGLVGLIDRVEALGGSIRVHIRPGQGTQIAVELPIELELPQPAD